VVIRRGELWWADLGPPAGSGPGFRRPVLVMQSDAFNASAVRTAIVAVMTSNLGLAAAPGNVRLAKRATGLDRESVVNVAQLVTIDKTALSARIGRLAPEALAEVADGIRLVLGL
jgi:mRNA interferase MazF